MERFPLRILELYSGIGGMHYAMKEADLEAEVVAAVDINPVANAIYKHNFPNTQLQQRSIESFTVKELDRLAPDMILMSPPCQPFVRVGKQRDAADQRSKSFLHFLDILPQLKKIPPYIFLENVKGFDVSDTRTRLLQMLQQCNYRVQEFLLSPLQFGIPNARLRYYLTAKREPLQFSFSTTEQIIQDVPECMTEYLVYRRMASSPSSSNRPCRDTHLTGTQSTKADSSEAVKCGGLGCSAKRTDDGSGETEDTTVGATKDLATNETVSTSQQPELGHSQSDSKTLELRTPNSQSDGSCAGSVSDEMLAGEKIGAGDVSANVPCEEEGTSGNVRGDDATCDKDMEDSSEGEDGQMEEEEAPLHERYRTSCASLKHFLEDKEDATYFLQYLLPEKFLRRFWVMDIVKASTSMTTCCFTKRYAHHMEGSGSILQMNENSTADLAAYKRANLYTAELEAGVRSLQLRYFTPREISNIMCFPPDFSFPEGLSNIQCYRVLGNSLNVHVVSVLLRLLTLGDLR